VVNYQSESVKHVSFSMEQATEASIEMARVLEECPSEIELGNESTTNDMDIDLDHLLTKLANVFPLGLASD
jgi:hypothetical protein